MGTYASAVLAGSESIARPTLGVTRIRFHDLRHSCATLLFAQGADLQTIKDLLGHSPIGVTSAIYVDGLREVQRDAVDHLGHLFGSGSDADTVP